MAPRQPLNDEQRRLLRIIARMPLASVANLASVLGLDEERVRRMLARLRSGGWVSSVMRGMTERRQHRYFLTSRAVDLLYNTDHQHPSPGRKPAPPAWRSSTRRANCLRTSGSSSPWTTTIPSTWRTRVTPPSSPESKPTKPTIVQPTTSTRPGPQRRGA